MFLQETFYKYVVTTEQHEVPVSRFQQPYPQYTLHDFRSITHIDFLILNALTHFCISKHWISYVIVKKKIFVTYNKDVYFCLILYVY